MSKAEPDHILPSPVRELGKQVSRGASSIAEQGCSEQETMDGERLELRLWLSVTQLSHL